jgi:hypothetical protein
MLIRSPSDATITDDERAHMATKVRRTIGDITEKAFQNDPLVVPGASLLTSKISSAYKRHGLILEEALRTALNTRGDLLAWDDTIAVPVRANPIQIDLVTYQANTQTLKAYEIKRGFNNQDAEARHSIEERLTALLGVLPSYAISKKLSAAAFDVAVVGYYDPVSGRIGAHRVIGSPDFASEFGLATAAFVETVNDYFRHCLLRVTSIDLVGGLQQIVELPAFREAVSPEMMLSAETFSSLATVQHPWDGLGDH